MSEHSRGYIDPRTTLNALIARSPETLVVLRSFGLDTCCGGALELRVAAQHHGLDLDELLAALGAAATEATP
jgi:iron-sulfur cluster repair protein YtfE (RIC family)